MVTMHILGACLVCLLLRVAFISAYEAGPRWGQATVVVNDALFVYGGKVDRFNQFSYTAAPNIDDILWLSLAAPFSAASPSWQLVSSSTNRSTSAGPSLAWSSITALNNSDVLVFGGQFGFDSTVSGGGLEILDVYSRIDPVWITLQISNQPPSRMRHSSNTDAFGIVYIFGGLKTDDSGIAFSDHFVFDPSTLSFDLLPTHNAPPDIYGHASIEIDDRIFVFGGFSPSQGLLPFSTIWVLNIKDLTWEIIVTANSSLPSPRLAFAAVLTFDGKVIIHGGCTESFGTNFDDGWVLDPTQNPMTWTEIGALSQLGGRRDHFAVPSGDQVIFGFGYGNNGPAPAPLQIYNTTSSSFGSGFVPPPITSVPTTLPVPTQTGKPSPTVSMPYSSTTGGIHPTSTYGPSGIPTTDPGSNNTTAIAVGTSFGVLGLIVMGLAAGYYVRRRSRAHEDERFMALGGDDDDDNGSISPHLDGNIPVAGMTETHGRSSRLLNSLGIASALGVASKLRSAHAAPTERRDMLADEDNRSFGEWYNSRRMEGRANSSWSLLNILGGGRRSGNASFTSHRTSGMRTPRREKSDPFSDGAGLVRDEETGFVGAAGMGSFGAKLHSRPQSRRELSYASYASSRSATSYRDPFLDPGPEVEKEDFQPMDLYTDTPDRKEQVPNQPSVRYVPPLSQLRPLAPPLSQQSGHPLSPLSEHTSQSTLQHHVGSSASSDAHSSDQAMLSPFIGSQGTSRTSLGFPPPAQSSSSILNSPTENHTLFTPSQPMRRSDSWWSRFSRTSLLDRRSSDASRKGYEINIRDPNPAPKLSAIEEGSLRSATTSKRSPQGSRQSSAEEEKARQTPPKAGEATPQAVYATAAHGKSMSSVRTADSEALERLAGTMDIALRVQSRNRWGSGSTSSQGGMSIDTHASSEMGDDNNSLRQGSVGETKPGADDLAVFVASPVSVDESSTQQSGQSAQKALRFAPIGPPPPADRSSTGKVSDRIQAYERRMSEGQPTSPPPTNSKHTEERTKKRVSVDYGLVPRASLFIANPDHRLSTRSDSSS